MSQIWDREKRCWVKVKALKNLTFRSVPGFKFFLHKAYKESGFVVTEEISGARVGDPQSSKTAAINSTRDKLKFIGVERLQQAIVKAMKDY